MGPLRQTCHDRFVITDEADVGAVRRAMSRYADALRVTADRQGQAELVATELATNLLRHAKPGGWVLARPVGPSSVELIAVDRGPGIADPLAAVEGRVLNPNGLGRGLAAVRRAASSFDLHTEMGRGTTVLAVVDLDRAPHRSSGHRFWAGVSIGLTKPCGDAWAVAEVAGGLAVTVVDGLGHGQQASEAADAAVDAFAADPADLDGFVDRANSAMRATRGGVVTVCQLWPDVGELRYRAVGNVSGRIVAGGHDQGLGLCSGVLGVQTAPPRVPAKQYPWPRGAVLVLWTDGLGSRLDLSTDAALLRHDPAVIAATLHRDHSRERDDATVVVVRNAEAP